MLTLKMQVFAHEWVIKHKLSPQHIGAPPNVWSQKKGKKLCWKIPKGSKRKYEVREKQPSSKQPSTFFKLTVLAFSL